LNVDGEERDGEDGDGDGGGGGGGGGEGDRLLLFTVSSLASVRRKKFRFVTNFVLMRKGGESESNLFIIGTHAVFIHHQRIKESGSGSAQIANQREGLVAPRIRRSRDKESDSEG